MSWYSYACESSSSSINGLCLPKTPAGRDEWRSKVDAEDEQMFSLLRGGGGGGGEGR